MVAWAWVLGCGAAEIAALEAEVAATKAQLAAVEARLDGLEQQARERQGASDPPVPVEELPPDLTPRQALADPAIRSRLGRATVHRGPDGQPDGFRVAAIRRGGLAARLGFRNGDVVRTVNGDPVRSLEEASAAWAKADVPTVDALTVEVSRSGLPLTLAIPLDQVPPPETVEPAPSP